MNKKTRLLLWAIFCFAGLILNIRAFAHYINKQDKFRIFMTGLWIVVFIIAAVSSIMKYRHLSTGNKDMNK